MHESQMHPVSSFVTLTFEQASYDPSLNYSDFQLFLLRMRRRLGPARYFVAGEYGSVDGRPHYHALLFGRDFLSDSRPCGKNLSRSPLLEALWPHGFSSVGEVTHDSAAYCAKYACKKVTGSRADSHYVRVDKRTGEFVRVVPEFAHMSLKPGIGYSWFAKYWRDCYMARDGVPLKGGVTVPAPRYYDKLLLELVPDLKEQKDFERFKQSELRADDNTPSRLAVKEAVHKARLKFYERSKL